MFASKIRIITGLLLAGIVLFLPFFTLPNVAMAQSETVATTGEAVIEEVLQKYHQDGTVQFVFDGLPRVYEVGAYVRGNLPYNIFPWAASYTFGWGTGQQLVINLQPDQLAYDEARRVMKEEAQLIAATCDTEERAFRCAYELVATTVTYDNNQTPDRQEQTLQGAVLERRAVCNGYATYLSALLNELDIFSYKVYMKDINRPNDPGHAVVRFYMEGEWWYTDPSSYAYNLQIRGYGYPEYYLRYPELTEGQILGLGNLCPERAEALREKYF